MPRVNASLSRRAALAVAALAALGLVLQGCVTPASQMKPAGPAPAPMDAANRVLVTTGDDPDQAYRAVARIMQRQGFTLGNTDETLRTITTDWKNFQGLGGEMRVTAFVDGDEEGSTITLSGKTAIRLGGGAFGQSAGTELQYSGTSSSPMRNGFEQIAEIARAYEDGEVAYERR